MAGEAGFEPAYSDGCPSAALDSGNAANAEFLRNSLLLIEGTPICFGASANSATRR